MNRFTFTTARAPTFLFPLAPAPATDGAPAAQEILECRLYMGVGTGIADRVEPTFSPVSLGTLRRSAVCVFADGRVAEKQFVEVDAARDGGATGTAFGYSVYGFENGDTLMARFEVVKSSTFNGMPLPSIALSDPGTDELEIFKSFRYDDFACRLG